MQPDVTVELVRAIVANADRLGLTWGLRIGTVKNGDDPSKWLVVLDGDETTQKQTPVVSMIGSRPAGTRVYVMSIPPAGKFAIGGASQIHEADDVSLSFGPATSFTQAVTFKKPFLTIPTVVVNINSGAGATAGWGSRAINIGLTGFTIFVFGTSSTWSSVNVRWLAAV